MQAHMREGCISCCSVAAAAAASAAKWIEPPPPSVHLHSTQESGWLLGSGRPSNSAASPAKSALLGSQTLGRMNGNRMTKMAQQIELNERGRDNLSQLWANFRPNDFSSSSSSAHSSLPPPPPSLVQEQRSFASQLKIGRPSKIKPVSPPLNANHLYERAFSFGHTAEKAE